MAEAQSYLQGCKINMEGPSVPTAQPAGNPLIQYLSIMVRHKGLVILLVLLATVSTAVISLVMDKTYQSTAVIMPPDGAGNPMMGMLGNLPMAGMLGDLGAIGGGSGDGAYFVTILNSRMIREELIEMFGLRGHYKMEQDKVEDVLEEVGKKVGSSFDMETGMIELAVRDKDPALAYEMASWMISRLEEVNRDLKTRRARNSRTFVAGEVGKIRLELDSLERSMLDFQEVSRIVEPEQQARVILEEYATIKSQEAVKELELRIARQSFGEQHPQIQQLERELNSIRRLRSETYDSGDSELFMAISQLPSASMEYLRRTRELEIANQKLLFLLPQLEQAKIDEVNDVPVLQVLDPPRQAEKRIRPKRTVMVILSAIVAWLVASVLVLFLHRLESDQEFADQLKGILADWKGAGT